MKILCIIILLNQLVKIKAQVCSFDPNCICSGTAVSCSGLIVSTNFPITTTSINLNGNSIVTVPSGAFAGLVNLEYLGLSINNLATLPADIFSDLTSLKILELDNNLLSTLPGAIFAALTSLETLTLYINELVSLPDGLFSGLTNLVSLLDENLLTTFPNGLFSGLTSLEKLSLNENPIICCSILDVIEFGSTLNSFNLGCEDFGQSVDYTAFNASQCAPAIDGNWSDWIDGGCSVSCGSGTIQRTRSCDNPAPANGGRQCEGASFEEVPCSLSNCPDEESCEDANGICLPKKFKCRTHVLDRKCGSCHQKCCEKMYGSY